MKFEDRKGMSVKAIPMSGAKRLLGPRSIWWVAGLVKDDVETQVCSHEHADAAAALSCAYGILISMENPAALTEG